MFGVAQGAFHNQANGSLVSYKGHVVGSSLLCQEFVNAKGNPLAQYFQPRPSDAVNPEVKTDYGCDPGFSAASNLGPEQPHAGAADQAAAEAVRRAQPREDLADPAGRGDRVRVGPGPGHLPAERRPPGEPGRRGAARQPVRGPGAGQPVRPGPDPGLPRRAEGERADPEHRARPAVPAVRRTADSRQQKERRQWRRARQHRIRTRVRPRPPRRLRPAGRRRRRSPGLAGHPR